MNNRIMKEFSKFSNKKCLNLSLSKTEEREDCLHASPPDVDGYRQLTEELIVIHVLLARSLIKKSEFIPDGSIKAFELLEESEKHYNFSFSYISELNKQAPLSLHLEFLDVLRAMVLNGSSRGEECFNKIYRYINDNNLHEQSTYVHNQHIKIDGASVAETARQKLKMLEGSFYHFNKPDLKRMRPYEATIVEDEKTNELMDAGFLFFNDESMAFDHESMVFDAEDDIFGYPFKY